MVPALFALGIPNLSVLIVDDTSPDQTAGVAKVLQAKFPNLFLLNREKKEGLGRAYIAGFRHALKREADALVQMDADFSHAPEDVLKLLEKLETADVAVGSRYVKGGRTVNWPLRRFALSRGANLYARFVTGVPVSDLTAGFKAWRRRCLEALDLDSIRTNGYGFQMETSFRAWKRGFRLAEVPITFTERRIGQSKMSGDIIREALLLVWKLRFGHP